MVGGERKETKPVKIPTVMRWLGALLLAGCLTVSPARGQSGTSKAKRVGEKPPTVAWVISAVFLGGSLVIVFKNPRRTHQG